MNQPIDECAPPIAASWMNDQIGLLAEHQHLVVFVKDIERDVFGGDLVGLGGRKDEVDAVTDIELVTVFCGKAIDGDGLLQDQLLDHRAGKITEPVMKILVNSPVRQETFDGQMGVLRSILLGRGRIVQQVVIR